MPLTDEQRGGPAPLLGADGAERRALLRAAALFGAGIFLPALGGCNGDPVNPAARAVLDTRTEVGVLNALYAMKQLTGDFFTRAAAGPYPGKTADEQATFSEIAAHEAAHVSYYVEVIRRGRVYDLLEFDFGGVDFTSRGAVLDTAVRLTDASAAAYLGALARLTSPDVRAVVAKIASVEARHSAAARALADVAAEGGATGTLFGAPAVVAVDTGLGVVADPAAAITAVRPFFRTALTIRS